MVGPVTVLVKIAIVLVAQGLVIQGAPAENERSERQIMVPGAGMIPGGLPVDQFGNPLAMVGAPMAMAGQMLPGGMVPAGMPGVVYGQPQPQQVIVTGGDKKTGVLGSMFGGLFGGG